MVAMSPETNPLDDPADARALAQHAAALADAVDSALVGWLERVVVERWGTWHGRQAPAELVVAARQAGERARSQLLPELRALLVTDVDEQRSNPLALIRRAAVAATTVLRDAGVPPVDRDEHAERLFPDDVYDLAPATFGDLDPSVQEPGLLWGAAKAHVILARRRRSGRG